MMHLYVHMQNYLLSVRAQNVNSFITDDDGSRAPVIFMYKIVYLKLLFFNVRPSVLEVNHDRVVSPCFKLLVRS